MPNFSCFVYCKLGWFSWLSEAVPTQLWSDAIRIVSETCHPFMLGIPSPTVAVSVPLQVLLLLPMPLPLSPAMLSYKSEIVRLCQPRGLSQKI